MTQFLWSTNYRFFGLKKYREFFAWPRTSGIGFCHEKANYEIFHSQVYVNDTAELKKYVLCELTYLHPAKPKIISFCWQKN